MYHIIKTNLGYVYSLDADNNIEFTDYKNKGVLFPFDVDKNEFESINEILCNKYKCTYCYWIIYIK
jgi:hypothetical protein